MSIDVDKMIKLVMTVISNLLDNGWKFRIVDKFIDGTLVLDDYGFCVLKGEEKIYVSPMYVIDLLVRSYYLEQEEFVYLSYKSFFEIDYQLKKENVYKAPSWVRIVYFLKKLENCDLSKEADNCINVDYINFKNYLKDIDYTYFRSILKALNKKSFNELVSVGKNDPILTKKIESLYYLEAFFIQYIKDEIEDEIELGDVCKQSDTISLEDYKIELATFFKIIKERNDFNILENDIKWLSNSYYGNKVYLESLLGDRNELLPSSLEVTLALDNYSLKKKADN